MGWLRLVPSFKLQVSFVEYRLFYRVLLQKRPIILSILLTTATPYLCNVYDLSILYSTYIMHLQMINFHILHSFLCILCIFVLYMHLQMIYVIYAFADDIFLYFTNAYVRCIFMQHIHFHIFYAFVFYMHLQMTLFYILQMHMLNVFSCNTYSLM